MRVTLTFNLERDDEETQGERLSKDYVDGVLEGLRSLGHDVTPLEVSGPPATIVDGLDRARPDLVFNMAEGTDVARRESYFAAIYDLMGIPYTGGGTSLLHLSLDKRLTVKILKLRGVRVPGGALLTAEHRDLPDDLDYPLMVKPNYEGSSIGITQESVVESRKQAREVADGLLDEFPAGVLVEEYIEGRELTVPLLQARKPRLLEIVEITFEGDEHDIFDYETKRQAEDDGGIRTHCPADLPEKHRTAVRKLAEKAFNVLRPKDIGRADVRLREDGVPFLLEVNPIPGLRGNGPVMISAAACGLAYEEVLGLIIASAARRYGLREQA